MNLSKKLRDEEEQGIIRTRKESKKQRNMTIWVCKEKGFETYNRKGGKIDRYKFSKFLEKEITKKWNQHVAEGGKMNREDFDYFIYCDTEEFHQITKSDYHLRNYHYLEK